MRDVAVVAVVDVLELVDVAVEHRRRRREPGKIRGVGARHFALRAVRFRGEGQECVDREWRACGAGELPPARLLFAGVFSGDPMSERQLALDCVWVVVKREHLRVLGLVDRDLPNERVRRE